MTIAEVSVGLPVYNGAATLRRAIDSVLAQTHSGIELVITDNASTDETETICRDYAARDPRVRYVRHPSNIGAKANFESALQHASAELFMWLGDDDWLDPDYLRTCIGVLAGDRTVALACGRAIYYRPGQPPKPGRVIQATEDEPRRRVLTYLREVMDNGTFYGVMRRDQIASIEFPDLLAGDWMVIASVAYLGKIVTCEGVHVHREMGMSSNIERVVTGLGLPPWNARYPNVAVALGALTYFTTNARVARGAPRRERLALGVGAALQIMRRPMIAFAYNQWRRVRRRRRP